MENTAKNFALQLGSLIALYVSIGFLLSLLFGIITIAYPDAADNYYLYESATSQVRFSIAALIVFFPTYLILTRLVNNIRRNEHGAYLTLTKWLIYLSLLVAGGVILGDLVAIINAFLNGDIAIRFVLKALAVFIVVGAAFTYYLLDARGYWQQNENQSIEYGGGAAAVVIAVLVLGFFHIEAPAQVREMKIDDLEVQDLSDMQWKINDYYQTNGSLPATLTDAYVGTDVPGAPQDRKAYQYNITDNGFELCAEFLHDSTKTNEPAFLRPMSTTGSVAIKNPDNWDHRAGWWCFERAVQQTTAN
jgi:hypothetical protein